MVNDAHELERVKPSRRSRSCIDHTPRTAGKTSPTASHAPMRPGPAVISWPCATARLVYTTSELENR